MGARARMTMRCATERDTASADDDPYGAPVTTLTQPLTSAPCYWQSRAERFVADGDKMVAVATHTMLLPLGADIHENDRVTSVRDREGKTLKDTKLRVMAVVRRESHLETMLEEYS